MDNVNRNLLNTQDVDEANMQEDICNPDFELMRDYAKQLNGEMEVDKEDIET
ncbi:hypothetical protein [Paenibacillus andongensis]|uniref:hypothetical protein n=1 Tax=Paenibacillus andongensis TaxID=2975482 RepID=UPI0021BA4C5D|nr:hypothetical protein [Paenibacillus andongensis]